MILYNRFLLTLGALFTLSTSLLAAYGQNKLDAYFTVYVIEYLVTTLLFVYLDRRARRLLDAMGNLLFGGFLIIVILKVVAIAETIVFPGIMAPAVAPAAPSRPIPHENPATAAVEADPTVVFEWYLSAVEALNSWRFREGRRIAVRLNQANLPPAILPLVTDTDGLLIKEGSILEAADAWMRQAAALIEAGRAAEAGPILRELRLYVRRGDLLFDDVVENFTDLARRSNVESLPPDNPRSKAYQDLQRSAVRIKALLVAFGTITRTPASTAAVARLLPYQTGIDLTVPAAAYPGRPFTVRGFVAEQAPAPSQRRLLTLSLDDQKLVDLPLGTFTQTFTLPPSVIPGTHAIVAAVPAQGRYLAATVRRDLQVVKATPMLRVRASTYALAPGRLEISGTATSEFGPLAGARVAVGMDPAAGQTQTTARGEFRLTLALPATLSLVGSQTLAVWLLPQEPWHGVAEVHVPLFIVNVVNVGLLGLLLVAAAIAYAAIRRRTRAAMPAQPSAVQGRITALQEVPRVPLPPGVRGQLLAIYIEVLRRVQAVTAVRAEPSMTLRDLVRWVQPRLHSDAFAEITTLAELTLYSAHPITEDHVEQARRISLRLEGELARAIP